MTDERETEVLTASYTEMTEMLLPDDANALGRALGGVVLHWMDICGAIASIRFCIDLLLRVNAEESHHGISGRAKRPVGFKTHTFQASSAGFQHRLGCLVARSKRPHP